ncbi:4-hydroxybenzoate octaprenyltransferase [endosymbiont of unidentified scaly snail isolate Monju]|uniref:4-hydroxybenzoate octaprenyltransferase n=1 Tax=endosymbiont of unidentified scaly snail isolate Monju TaxID=1248727 RepID=UPI000389261E|nr:4-hydroxybenzoate octaprenyltransferase [endosymbiont of unidentified scaly snail isolate Monju]BAN68216.1 4-hydroxybenzoate octaprenyltransferase [endosymbiont of unidentified scaly snail isolate Monju]
MSEQYPRIDALEQQRPAWQRRLRAYWKLIRADRPIGIFLLLWPALWALWIAGEGNPPWQVALIFVLGTVLMRSAGCAINDYADRDFDGHVERTAGRPLATGLIRPREALAVFAVLALAAFGLVLFLNRLTVMISFVAVTLAAVYPFMKRYTHLPQLVLGMAFGWAVPMAFTALHGTVPPFAWELFAATVIWALIYDTEYAMVDREDDLRIGIKSSAILFGRHDRLIIGLLQLAMLALLWDVGRRAGLGWGWWGGLLAGAGLFAWQQVLIRHRERQACFRAFLNNNAFGLVLFLGLFLDYLSR